MKTKKNSGEKKRSPPFNFSITSRMTFFFYVNYPLRETVLALCTKGPSLRSGIKQLTQIQVTALVSKQKGRENW